MQDRQTVALLTGCSSGIGRALALEFSRRAVRVVATARRPEAIADLAAAGMTALRLDVTDEASIAAAVAEAIALHGQIDLLINNAGFGLIAPTPEITPAELRRQLETNVVGAHAVIRAVAPAMIARRSGVIVNVGSVSGVLTTPFAGAYGASKAALHALGDALRVELAPFGVRVVTLQPGGVVSRFGEVAAARAVVAPSSPFAPFAAAVARRAGEGQRGAVAAEVFARRVVPLLLRPDPPPVIRAGTHSLRLPLLRWLVPVRLLDRLLAHRYGLAGAARRHS